MRKKFINKSLYFPSIYQCIYLSSYLLCTMFIISPLSVLTQYSVLTPSSLLLLITFIWSLNNLYWYFVMSVCFSNSLPNGEFSNLLTVAAFSNSPFSGKPSLPVKNSYLLTFPKGKVKIFVRQRCSLQS